MGKVEKHVKTWKNILENQEKHGKTWENMEKHGKILENMGNIGKLGKPR